jgi:hypothetical protein
LLIVRTPIKKAPCNGSLFYGSLDPGRSAEVDFIVRGPTATFAVIPDILNDLTHPIKLIPGYDLAQVILLMAAVAAFAFMDILAHVFSP